VRLALLGVRGSTPAPGARFDRYGGHTSAVAVIGDDEELPSLVLDAGTGLRELPGLLGREPFRGTIVLSHLHWDHVQGIPFCPAVDRPDAAVDLHVPGRWRAAAGSPEGAYRLLARAMSPPHFPITPGGLHGAWSFVPARRGTFRTAVGAAVTLIPIPHKGGVAFGVRVEVDGGSAAYLPDHALAAAAPDPGALELARGADVLLHDGQFTEAEQHVAVAYGHATVEAAVRFADDAQVGSLVLTHHAPGRTDEELDELAARWPATRQGRPVTFARQGSVVEVPGHRPVTRARRRPASRLWGDLAVTGPQSSRSGALTEPSRAMGR
jgi:ribonuclease BN (tRNA processing enzyme)